MKSPTESFRHPQRLTVGLCVLFITHFAAVAADEPSVSLSGHDHTIYAICFNKDGSRAASADLNQGSIIIWNLMDRNKLKTIDAGCMGIMAAGRDLGLLATSDAFSDVILWDVASSKEVGRIPQGPLGVASIRFNRDFSLIAIGGTSGVLETAHVKTAKSFKTLGGLGGSKDGLYSLDFHPTKKAILASGGWDKRVRIWDIEAGKNTVKMDGHEDKITSVVFSPDEKSLASASMDKTIRLWDWSAGKEISAIHNDSPINSIAFSPNGNWIASGDDAGNAKIWNIKTGKLTRSIKADKEQTFAVAFSPDGKHLAAGGTDKLLKIWKVEP